MQETDIKLLKDELNKLVGQQIKVTNDDSNWILTIKNTQIKVPKIQSIQVRKTILTNK